MTTAGGIATGFVLTQNSSPAGGDTICDMTTDNMPIVSAFQA